MDGGAGGLQAFPDEYVMQSAEKTVAVVLGQRQVVVPMHGLHDSF
jgi:hypothetical protein